MDEIQSVRAFGQETEVMQLQTEVARRLAGPTGLQSNMEFTFEHMPLAVIQGLLIDADGSTLFDWFAEFGITVATEIALDRNRASPIDGAASQGAFIAQTRKPTAAALPDHAVQRPRHVGGNAQQSVRYAADRRPPAASPRASDAASPRPR